MAKKHNHYYKDVSKFKEIDVYRVLSLFAVTDPCIGHAIKKLLVAGGRGAGKDISQDIKEAIDSLERWQEMREEEKETATAYTVGLSEANISDQLEHHTDSFCKDANFVVVHLPSTLRATSTISYAAAKEHLRNIIREKFYAAN